MGILMKTYDSPVSTCNLCDRTIGDTFIDGATAHGWCIMCPSCHRRHGKGLGLGKGQRYWRRCGVWVDTDVQLTEKETRYLLSLAEPFDHMPRPPVGVEPEED